MKLQGVGLRILTHDVTRLYDFYTQILGFEVNWGERGWSYVSYSEQGSDKPAFAVFAHDGMVDYPDYESVNRDVMSDKAVYCISVDDVDAAYAELSAKGVPFIGEPRDIPNWYMRCVMFRDPDGNLFEISGPLKSDSAMGV